MDKTAICMVCDKIIKEPSTRTKGHDSVFCEGICQGWIHRQCAGIPKPLFVTMSNSEDPFLCLYCSNSKIRELKQTIQDLMCEVKSLKFQAVSLLDHELSTPLDHESSTTIPSSSYTTVVTDSQAGQGSRKGVVPPAKQPVDSNSNRKFNFVVYGIKEQPKGTPRHMRLIEDAKDVSDVIRKLDASIPDNSVCDCTRLGKFSENKCRPILAKMSRTCEVSSILRQRRKLKTCPGISIKPDMTPSERKVEFLLMSERWNLIQSGVDKVQIKIRGKSIYVSDTKVGSVVNLEYRQVQESLLDESVQPHETGASQTN